MRKLPKFGCQLLMLGLIMLGQIMLGQVMLGQIKCLAKDLD